MKNDVGEYDLIGRRFFDTRGSVTTSACSTAVAVLVVVTICSSSSSLLRCDTRGRRPLVVDPVRRHDAPGRACGSPGLPARESELLGLGLHVVVVEGSSLLGAADAGAD